MKQNSDDDQVYDAKKYAETLRCRESGQCVSSQMIMLPSGVYGAVVPSLENVTGGRPPFFVNPLPMWSAS
ncbi:MAG: hypothetical protein M3176_15750, partial [Chloroflexota bacterium]|nr:hypothetical protein [Chloroflexota bacterium]